MLPRGGETPDSLGGKKKSRRVARINERIREIVSEVVLFELKDPRIGFVTILEVEVTPNLKEGTVSISVMGTDTQKRLTLEAIEHSHGYIQRQLGKQLQTRSTPVLRFKLAEKSEKEARLEEAFEKLRKEREGEE